MENTQLPNLLLRKSLNTPKIFQPQIPQMPRDNKCC